MPFASFPFLAVGLDAPWALGLLFAAGPALGDPRAGLIRAGLGPRPSIWLGGVSAVVATTLVPATLPALWRYRCRATAPRALARDDDHDGES